MSRRRRMLQHILASPGATTREVTIALGMNPKHDSAVVSAQLSMLCREGKLRKDSLLQSGPKMLRFWPTDATADAARDPVRKAGKRVRRAPPKAAPRPPKPPASADMTIVRKPRPAPVYKPTAEPEAIAAFLARGGQIERLPNGAVSRTDLRFDYTHSHRAPSRGGEGRRRPCAGHA